MNINFADQPRWDKIGYIWLLLAVLFLLNVSLGGSFLSLLLAVINTVLGVTYIRITKVPYLVVSNKTITIFRRLIGKKEISLEQIEKHEVKERFTDLILKNGQKSRIKHSWITKEELTQLHKRFEEYV
ncbi:hypothetical protein GMD78_05940 [Ornithinibacillus sp. L9]|uniref:DUF5673 domain-containing protein n=1 Tax=Ornithinibacillus caprae TaxID=2678566 RepID=A0A6N8FKX1_9BACI|nr:hypothetical protein [Ornithinibacillus caprae]MUK87938.1 hypothetical protein [Ornithinibacillus caprae]